jgi:hypothetical protein
MRRWRQPGVTVIGALLLALLAVIATAIQIAEYLALLTVIAAVAAGATYLGQLHERRRARPRQVQPRPAWPEEPAAAPASPAATLPLAVPAASFSWDQDDQVAPQPLPGPPAGPDRDELLADRMSGTRPLWEPE